MLENLKHSSEEWKNAQIPENKVDDLQVFTERNIGKYRGVDCRLDILLMNKKWQICIENKFDAGQGEEQLERYSDYLNEDKARDTLLIYITKNDDDYHSKELLKGKDYYCISYKNDILNWINSCIEKCSKMPIIQQSLIQYANLIKQKTNQTISKEMKNEIQQLILSSGIKGAKKIHVEYENVMKFITEDIRIRIKQKLEIENKFSNIGFNEKFGSVFISIQDYKYIVGIEGLNFNLTSWENDALFIGQVNFNNKDAVEKKNYWKGVWLKQGREIIWKRNELFAKIEEYGKHGEKRDEIIQEIVDYVKDYVKRIMKK